MNSKKRQKDMIPEVKLPRSEGVQYPTREEWRAITNSSRKNEEAGPKQKQHSVMDVPGGVCKVQCCIKIILHRNLECHVHKSRKIGCGQVGNDKSEHQHLRNQWTKIRMGMREFNSNDHLSITVGKNPLEKWISPHSQQKSPKCSAWVHFQK